MRGGKKDLMTFHSKKLAEYMSIDLDGGKAFEISTVIGIYIIQRLSERTTNVSR